MTEDNENPTTEEEFSDQSVNSSSRREVLGEASPSRREVLKAGAATSAAGVGLAMATGSAAAHGNQKALTPKKKFEAAKDDRFILLENPDGGKFPDKRPVKCGGSKQQYHVYQIFFLELDSDQSATESYLLVPTGTNVQTGRVYTFGGSPQPCEGKEKGKFEFLKVDYQLVDKAADSAKTNAGDAQFFEEGADVALKKVVGGLTVPTEFADAQEDRDRWFVTDQAGVAYYVEGGEKHEFITVKDRMVELGNIYGQYPKEKPGLQFDERGLIGITFHPNFTENRKFYLRYSAPPDDELPDTWDHYNILSEFKASEDLNSGIVESERQLLRLPHPQMNHNAGPITFGPDGYLYVTMGDGGGANDDYYGHVDDWYGLNSGGNAQDVTENLLGTIMRIDPDGGNPDAPPVRTGTCGDADRPYGIPDDNPLVGTDGLDEIYAWGLRNPYGIDFDSNGNLFAPDAGQHLYEEINIILKGGNYGWNLKEGTHCFNAGNFDKPPSKCPDFAPSKTGDGVEPLIDPIVEFPHFYKGEKVAAVVTGGHVYEGDSIPALQGKYVYPVPAQKPFKPPESLEGRLLTAAPPDGEIGEVTIDDLEPNFPTDAEVPSEFINPSQDEAKKGQTLDPGLVDKNNKKDEIPRDQLWDMAQANIVGTDDGTPNRSIRYIGQDSDGELYALTAEVPVPKGSTGSVHKIVPPDSESS